MTLHNILLEIINYLPSTILLLLYQKLELGVGTSDAHSSKNQEIFEEIKGPAGPSNVINHQLSSVSSSVNQVINNLKETIYLSTI
jgi:hypothetical protein